MLLELVLPKENFAISYFKKNIKKYPITRRIHTKKWWKSIFFRLVIESTIMAKLKCQIRGEEFLVR